MTTKVDMPSSSIELSEIDILRAKSRELQLMQEKIRLQQGLPHIYGWKFYKWSREYFDSRNKITLLSAANQISKSSTAIRKHIHWATEPALWPSLWGNQPRQFWYLYPTRDVAHIEFRKKWEPEFMPRGEFKEHPTYGWKAEYYHNRIFAIHWNTGISTYFKTYAQDVQDLQTGTVSRIDLDEEPQEEIMSELFMRLAATDGYMSAVFTPTMGQDYWAQAFEIGSRDERFVGAWKRQVSMYECLEYEDGSPSHWTLEKIKRATAACKSDADVQRRVFGKFVVSEGLKYPSFNATKNRKVGHHVPKDWSFWCGVDVGSGGDAHPAAICIVGVSPDFKMGRVIDGWRGDGMITTASDIVAKTKEMTKSFPYCRIKYDWASADFNTIATEMGLQVERAEKSHAIGEGVLNTLFKNNMLMIYDAPELDKLVSELKNLKNSTQKTKAKDDFIDALRYACSSVPWNWDALVPKEVVKEVELTPAQKALKERRNFVSGEDELGLMSADDEIAGWNELMGENDGSDFGSDG